MNRDYLRRTYPISGMLQSSVKDGTTCTLCDLLAGFLIGEKRSGMTTTNILSEAYYVCTKFKIEEDDVCMGVLQSMIVSCLSNVIFHRDILE